jgi:hypothetical protein
MLRFLKFSNGNKIIVFNSCVPKQEEIIRSKFANCSQIFDAFGLRRPLFNYLGLVDIEIIDLIDLLG